MRDVLSGSKYVVVLDHLARPSQSLAASVRELKVSCSVAVVAVARSQHMEDAGYVLPLFPEGREKLALKNFDRETAMQFAVWCAEREQLMASNQATFLERVVDYSGGNPGAMLEMIRMARRTSTRATGISRSARYTSITSCRRLAARLALR